MGDLENIFEILRKHKLCLNASKCSFGMGLGKFLGYMVTHHGIEVNLDQVKEINRNDSCLELIYLTINGHYNKMYFQ